MSLFEANSGAIRWNKPGGCIQNPDHIEKTEGRGQRGGFIWYFRKSFDGRTLQIVAEVHENRCYGITGYWLQ
jgi:hypothetical protein